MGHFKITLSNNQQGDVRWGTVRKKTGFRSLFKSSNTNTGIKKGYIIHLTADAGKNKEYRFLKSNDGNWATEDDGGFTVSQDDPIAVAIKKAIDEYESLH